MTTTMSRESSTEDKVLNAIKRQKKHESEAARAMRERDEGIRAMRAAGLSCPAIARKTGLSTSLIRILVR